MTLAAEAAPARRAAGAAVPALLFASGVAGLGYQIVWTRMLTVGLGHEVFAVLAVVAGFFAGLAVGAAALDRVVARSRRPGAWYAGLEAAIGLWTLALIWLIPAANAWIAEAMGPAPSEGRRWAVAFGATALLLLPATAAMGASLPAAERMAARLARDGRRIGGLYAANAAGATVGALATAVWLAPAMGYSATLAVFAAVNLGCAALTLAGPARGEAARPPLPAAEAGRGPTPALLAALFVTGLAGIGFEVAVLRALASLLENTIYSFAAVLSVYLVATAAGAALYQRLYAARRGPGWDAPALRLLSGGAALACATGVMGIHAVPATYDAVRGIAPPGMAGAMTAEIACAGLALALPAMAMAALFTHLAQAARGPGGGIGAALAVNTAGAALAPLVTGVALIPALGVMGAMAALALAYALLAPAARPRGAALALWICAGATVAVALSAFDRRIVTPPPGGRVLAHREGVAANASVVAEADGTRWLRVNGTMTMGGSATGRLDRIQGHTALLMHPDPRTALFLGVGTGATLAAAADHPALAARGVELLPEVLDLIPAFPEVIEDFRAAAGRVGVSAGDARRAVRTGGRLVDVILADTYHPAKDGAGLLYTVEHFAAIRERLAPGGVFVQWLPLHQLDMATLRLIVRTYLAVFPDARMQMGNQNLATPLLALIGSETGRPPALADLAARPMPDALRAELARLDFATVFALFGGFMAGPEALSAFAGPGPLNTDDHPRVVFEAPRSVYAGLGPAEERLLALVRRFSPEARHAVTVPPGMDGALFEARLEAYWRARDAFLRVGAESRLTGNPNEDARLLVPPLLGVLRTSPDFVPAYFPVLNLARAVAGTERQVAVRILSALEAAVPQRREAGELREAIEARPRGEQRLVPAD